MTEGIIIAVLGLVGTLLGSYLAGRKNTALVAYRLDQLEIKVDRHNQIVERTYEIERKMSIMKDHQESFDSRLKLLEKEEDT